MSRHVTRPGGRRRRGRAALVAVALIAAVTYLAFAKSLPFSRQFEVHATVRSTYGVKTGNPVRIAGLDVGRVTGVAAGPQNSTRLTLRLDQHDGVHADASFSIEPRLFLEGNDYVDLRPGTPGAPPLRDGAHIPLARTSGAVQLDQVLDVLDAPTRDALRTIFDELGHGLGAAPGGGPVGAAGMREASRQLAGALPSFTRVALATRGTREGDLRRTVASSRDVVAQLAADPRRLAGLVSDGDRVAAAMARRSDALRATISGLDDLARAAPGRLRRIDAVLAPLRRFVTLARPALRIAPRPLRATSRLLAELDGLVQPRELGGLLPELAPVTAALPGVERELRRTFPLVTAVGRCVTRNIVPTMNKALPDGRLSTGRPAWQDMLHMAAALTGTSPGFDGNGGTLRISVAEGANGMRGVFPGLGTLTSPANLEGVRPTWLGYGVTPAFRPDARCDEQPLPDLAARADGGAPAGWQPIPARAPGAMSPDRRSLLLRLLYGSSADHRRLRHLLLGELPAPAARRRATGHRRPAVPRPPAGARPTASHRPAPVAAGRPLPAAAQAIDAVGQVVDGELGRLLKGLPR